MLFQQYFNSEEYLIQQLDIEAIKVQTAFQMACPLFGRKRKNGMF